MSIGITGASGQLGGAVAARLLDVVDAVDVVLMSRTVESLADFAARGVGVRPVDFGDPPSLALAFEGVDSLLLISTDRVGALVGSGSRRMRPTSSRPSAGQSARDTLPTSPRPCAT